MVFKGFQKRKHVRRGRKSFAELPLFRHRLPKKRFLIYNLHGQCMGEKQATVNYFEVLG